MVPNITNGSVIDFFRKNSWLNVPEDFEVEIFKKLFEKYFPTIDCIFYKTSAKYVHLYHNPQNKYARSS